MSFEKKWPIETSSSSVVLIDEPNFVQQAPVRIRHYFVFSLFSAICLCPITGLIALAYSIKSSAKADVKLHDKARLYSRRSLLWNIISVLFVIFTSVVGLIICYQIGEMVRVYGNQINQDQRLKNIDNLLNSITKD